MLEQSVELYRKFIGTGMIAGLFLVALIYLFVTEKNRNNRVFFVYMPVVALVLFFCPAFTALIDHFVGTEIYFRFLWLLPTLPVIAYAAVRFTLSCRGRGRIAAGIVSALLIVLFGSFIYENPEYKKAENVYHIPQYVVDVCDAIKEEDGLVVAAFPMEFSTYVRQYDANIWMPYGRDHYRGMVWDEMCLYMLGAELEVERVTSLARERNCHYVILSQDRMVRGDWQDCGYELYDSVDGYLIYRDTQMPPGLIMYWQSWQ